MKLPRPPRVVADRRASPEPTMPTPAPLNESDGHVNEARPVVRRRRRALMGEVVRSVSVSALKPADSEKAEVAREHRELVRKYSKGGRSKGESLRFGATASDPLVDPETT
jgi:hypothetical protein